MKLLLMITVMLMTSVGFANGFERLEDSKRANKVSWEMILNGERDLLVDNLSVRNPVGASLFNVCVYDDNHFRVIMPSPKCIEYKTVEIPEPKQENRIVKTCVKREAVDFKLIGSSYSKCVETKVVKADPLQRSRNRVDKVVCTKTAMVPVPVVQKVDVLLQRRDNVYAFSKTYEVPDCQNTDLPDKDIPDTKK